MAPVTPATVWQLALGNLNFLPHQQTKTCIKCGDTKLVRYFGSRGSGYPGVRNTCNACMSANANAFNKRNRARAKERSRHAES